MRTSLLFKLACLLIAAFALLVHFAENAINRIGTGKK
jgi:hypothetical protein